MPFIFTCHYRQFEKTQFEKMTQFEKDMDRNRNIDVMGIINLTDNSYFAESRCLDAEGNDDLAKVLGRAGKMIEEGAGILDIGACSTRPGSNPVGEEEEWRRLAPALKAIRREFPDIRISIDTYWPSVVEKVYDAIGDFIVNDVTAGCGMAGMTGGHGMAEEGGDSGADARKGPGECNGESCGDTAAEPGEMLRTAGRLGLTFVAMHMRGNPKTMQSLTEYNDVTGDIVQYFKGFSAKAEAAGIKDWILDPGFGFAKDIGQNYELLRRLGDFSGFGRKILVGVSRKSMIYRKFGITPEESLPATQVLHFKALCNGADILRVHDVAEAARTVALYRELG